MARIFVTGGTGFVGTRVLEQLCGRGHEVVALCRAMPESEAGPAVQCLRGDLADPGGWRDALASCDIVLHLAARTGKAPADLHLRDNLRLTEGLLEACRDAGVRRFVFASTIVAKCPNLSRYPYARAKAEAEARVRESGLSFTIVRPTLVFGAGSPNLDSLRTLACAPVMPVFGNGRTKVQPIHVDDLAELIAEATDDSRFEGGEFDLGGPEVITMEDLLRRIRQIVRGDAGRAVHLPVGMLMTMLWWLERLIGAGALPLTSGQLSTFRYDTAIEPNPLVAEARERMMTIEQMLRSSLIA